MSNRIDAIAANLLRAPFTAEERTSLLDALIAAWRPTPAATAKAKPASSGRRWSPEEDAMLIKLRKDGLSPREIAPRLGRTAHAVVGRTAVIAPELIDPIRQLSGAISRLSRGMPNGSAQ